MYLIASAIVTVPKDRREIYNRILNPTKSNITLYNQKVAVLSEAPTNCVVSSLNLPGEGVQPSFDIIFAEDLQNLIMSNVRRHRNYLSSTHMCLREKNGILEDVICINFKSS